MADRLFSRSRPLPRSPRSALGVSHRLAQAARVQRDTTRTQRGGEGSDRYEPVVLTVILLILVCLLRCVLMPLILIGAVTLTFLAALGPATIPQAPRA